jgi:KipI family sensor histidine kinase inhibitor
VSEHLQIKTAGDSALVVEFEERIDPAVSARVLELDRMIADAAIAGVLETLPTYRTLLVRFDPLAVDAEALETRLAAMARAARADAKPGRIWHIPVAYGGALGEDLEPVARENGLSSDEFVRRHAGATYHVYMIGFVPGFTYLGGLDASLHISRRVNPRLIVPGGTVSIGGQQAAIQSIDAPSGWHILGRTPVRVFDLRRERPFLIAPGERVRFVPIDAPTFAALDARAAAGETIAQAQP